MLKKNWGRSSFLVMGTAFFVVTGCSSQKRPPLPSLITKKKAELQLGKVAGKGWYLPWYRLEKGKYVPVLIANADNGDLLNKTGWNIRHQRQNYLIAKMNGVNAEMYSMGKHTLNVVASHMTLDQKDNSLVGTGGCTVTSLQNPPNTVLTADRIEWKTDGRILRATGHTKLISQPKPQDAPITQEGESTIYDMVKEKIFIK